MSLPGFTAGAALRNEAHPFWRVNNRLVRARTTVGSGLYPQALWPPSGPPFVGRCTPGCHPCQPGDASHWCIDSSCHWYQRSCILPGGGGGGGLVPGDGTGGATVTT